ncbi:hypothetical protein CY34DRAFT_675884 [Suillus luteus UH-Slu-Lm8-n1]|uniref:Uncharacterized protein n=1 Tax=Suillus luteus UH-Slu-Lm8-n1 TaxID=930992 RepID=A0A0C9Z8Z6_9AGAM|nr:hypothetical protein CY34DRAFT_675884 [Suillus luteus UH-Slu-Lm8-n1]
MDMSITPETICDSPRTPGKMTAIYGTQVGALWIMIGVKTYFEERCSSQYKLGGTNILME